MNGIAFAVDCSRDTHLFPASKLLHILAAVAQFERELIRERTLAGIRVAQANGKQLGRPKRVFRRDELMRLREEGQSWRGIAAKLGIPVMTAVDAYRDYCTETVAANGTGQRGKLRGKSPRG
jgi:putative DNA-invertase from lambdoid prophage Rac